MVRPTKSLIEKAFAKMQGELGCKKCKYVDPDALDRRECCTFPGTYFVNERTGACQSLEEKA